MGVPVCRLRGDLTLRQIACAAACACVLAVCIGCGNSPIQSSSEIDFVRNGFLKVRSEDDTSAKTYQSTTIGKALERRFKNGTWREYSSPDGLIVEFDAAVLPTTLYQNGFSVWSPFSRKDTAAIWGVPGEKGSLSLRAATTCINDGHKRVAKSTNGGRIVIDCRLLFQMQFTVSADKRKFALRYISLATFDTDDEGKALGYIYG